MALQDPNRQRPQPLVTVECTCRLLTGTVSPFKDPHRVCSDIGTIAAEQPRAAPLVAAVLLDGR
jgi:hypothetical protein